MTDPRVAPVEDNLLSFMAAVSRQPRFELDPADDVLAASSDVAFPLFNPISGARFAPGTAEERTRQLVTSYVLRGLPFLWWLTPSTTSPELEAVLDQTDLVREDIPGMHVRLDGPLLDEVPAGLELAEVHTRGELGPFIDTMLEAFGMPKALAEEFIDLLSSDPRLIHLGATLDGRLVATGSAWLEDDTIGLYNIATLADARGRGIGRAVTARLMDLGRERGATAAVLHASEAGLPVYERLGFTTVCPVPQYVWVPPEP